MRGKLMSIIHINLPDPGTISIFQTVVGNLRYHSDFTMPGLSFPVSHLGA